MSLVGINGRPFEKLSMEGDNVNNSKSFDEDTAPEFVSITDVLDLHGFFPEQVPEILLDFIANAKELGLYELKIIHGKGKSKLKHACYTGLKRNQLVARFYDAPPERGGWGATIIELK
jgi:DNA-nicking Smr family endonuclease